MPTLSLLLAACENNPTNVLSAAGVIILVVLGYNLYATIKEDAAKQKAADAEAGRQAAWMNEHAFSNRAALEELEGLGTAKINSSVNIQQFWNEDIMTHMLQQGKTITVYRGFKPEHPPEIGQVYSRTFSGTVERRAAVLEKLPIERLIEEVRQERFPDSPSRLDSVFVTTSASDAREFGDVYELEISLKPGATESGSMPVRWLDRNTIDHMHSYNIEQARDSLREIAEDYWTETGSPQGISDILLDPNLVLIRVVRRV
ncbi:MAG: hypothetical protein JW782_06185 [Candidatus Saganbacteria bacterium]|nr:hypothetical protein [Candidatus Saganbacteria bacterium]